MSEAFNLAKSAGRIEIVLHGHSVGQDLQVTISGGDRPHIGAVAVSYQHPGLKDPGRPEVTTSVICLPGHKEDMLARNAAHRIAADTGLTTSVSCGIHIEQISKQKIQTVQELVEQLLDEFVACIKAGQ